MPKTTRLKETRRQQLEGKKITSPPKRELVLLDTGFPAAALEFDKQREIDPVLYFAEIRSKAWHQ